MTIELMIAAMADQLKGLRHVAVGAQSPIPATAALLAKARAKARHQTAMQVSILGSETETPFTDGGKELFDCAAQGRIDAFFLSGGQIDGDANINLVGAGPQPLTAPKPRFPGSFGSAYLYFLVPRVILFREEHSPRTLVERVDFISAPGTSAPEVYRPGGPKALITGKAVFRFDPARPVFVLESLHEGETLEGIKAATGFAFDVAPNVRTTGHLSSEDEQLLQADVLPIVARTYGSFVRSHWK
jgi:glutaconate CoA-transferase, subunit B